MYTRLLRALATTSILAGAGCVGPASTTAPPAQPSAGGLVREGTPDDVNIAKQRSAGKKVLVDWQPWSDTTFERAKREGKFILVDGAAAWCHWCHVMDETTYSDSSVGKILAEKFVAVRVDIDERPDLAERYGEWGWPATIVLSPDAEEVGKFQGYITTEDLLPILEGVGGRAKMADDPAEHEPGAPVVALSWMFARSMHDLDGYYDPEHGGWGMRQKAPIGEDAELAIALGENGRADHEARGLTSLAAERPLIDRVAGGMYQYSAGSDWNEAHYEKLMTVQASNLEAYARAYAKTGDAALLADARDLERYMDTVLSSPDGAYYVTQDADVNAHEPSKPFVDGKVYYERDAAGRAELGTPRVDTHVYGFENGIAIAAVVRLYQATHDPALLARAKKAADRMLRTHVESDGSVKHDAESSRGVLYLADAAALGRALTLLADASRQVGDPGEASYREAALRIAKTMDEKFAAEGGALYAQTVDTHAAGVFMRRRKPFQANVLAARFHTALARSTGDRSHEERAVAILAGIATPSGVEGQGRMIGSFVLALDEVGVSETSGPGSPPAGRRD